MPLPDPTAIPVDVAEIESVGEDRAWLEVVADIVGVWLSSTTVTLEIATLPGFVTT